METPSMASVRRKRMKARREKEAERGGHQGLKGKKRYVTYDTRVTAGKDRLFRIYEKFCIMIEYYNNILAVEANWLIESGIMTESQYKHLVERKQLNVVRRGCRSTTALVGYESLPERFKREVDRELRRNPHELAKENLLQKLIHDDVRISVFFGEHLLADGRHLRIEKQREYYANAIVLKACHEYAMSKRMNNPSRKVWEKLRELVANLDRVKYPHNLPDNARRLQEKCRQYKSEGEISLIHKNFLNNNANKVGDGVQENMLMVLLSDPRNLDNEQVARLYNTVAEQMKWHKITSGTVANRRDKFDTDMYARRRGLVAFSNTKAMQVKRSAPTRPLSYLTLDGWDVELLYQATATNKQGYSTTTYHNRPCVVIVLDPCGKYPLGYAIGERETPELIKAALRDAMHHTAQLFGQMYRAHQVQSDRYSIKKMTPYYETIADKVTPAKAKNAKAKIIEPFFNYLNKTYCQMLPNWSGYGITSNKDKQANSEFLNTIKKTFPDFDGVCRQVVQMIDADRAKKYESYMQSWDKTPATDKIAMAHDRFLLAFGDSTKRRILLQGSGLQPTILGQKRDYDCFDVEFRRHASVSWEVRYDPQDLSRVLAVNEDGSLQFVLEEKYVQPMALLDRKEGDSEALQRVRDFNNQLVESVTNRICGAQEDVRELMEGAAGNPELDTLRKLLITDSRGSHKDERNKARKAIGAKAEVVEEVEDDFYDMY